MNRRYSAIAASALVLGAAALTATEASAQLEPGPSFTNPIALCNYPNHPVCVVAPAADLAEVTTAQSPSQGNETEGLRVGASTLGAAGLAFGALWLYRRRRLPAL